MAIGATTRLLDEPHQRATNVIRDVLVVDINQTAVKDIHVCIEYSEVYTVCIPSAGHRCCGAVFNYCIRPFNNFRG